MLGLAKRMLRRPNFLPSIAGCHGQLQDWTNAMKSPNAPPCGVNQRIAVVQTILGLIRNQKMQQLTKDHTEAQRLCELGKITREQIFQHPDRDLLTSALGFENPRIDIRAGRVQSEDIVMLLTDGAHKVINSDQLHQIIFECGNCFDTCNGIIKVANALGGPDNISVCVSYLKK